MIFSIATRRTLAGLAVSLIALPAAAAQLEITFTNLNPTAGFSFTPLWAAFHDGGFDAFDVGGAASAGVESLAEVGQVGGLNTELAAADADGQAFVLPGTTSGPPTVDPGETASLVVDVDAANARFFTFLTMLVPSNDTFLGSDGAQSIELFDAVGNFLGDQVLTFTAADLLDAGTEVNDATNGPAFVVGQDGAAGADEFGVIHGVEDLSEFAGLITPAGTVDGTAIDFGSDPTAFNVGQITIAEVTPVPLPPTLALAFASLASFGMVRLRRRA